MVDFSLSAMVNNRVSGLAHVDNNIFTGWRQSTDSSTTKCCVKRAHEIVEATSSLETLDLGFHAHVAPCSARRYKLRAGIVGSC